MSNSKSIDLLLAHGAKPVFTEDEWSRMEEIINYRSHSYDKDGQIKQRSMLRCPMALSAMIADVECLRSFCSYDKSLSNSSVPMPAPKSSTGYQRNFSSYEYRQSSNAETISVRIMDILKEKLQNASDQNGKRGKPQNEQYREQVKQAEMKVIEARKMRDSLSVTSTKTTSFESFVWSLLLDREESNLQNLKNQSKYYGDIDGEDDIGGSESVAQIESAIKIIKENGGICEVSSVVETKTKTKDIEIESGMKTNNEDYTVNLYDPSKDFQELSYSSFSSSLWQFTRTKNGNTTACSKGSSEATLCIFDLIAKSNFDELNIAITSSKMCVQSTLFQTTPLFVSVLYGSLEAAKLVFKTSIDQYQRHVKKVEAETRQRKEHEEEMNKRLAKLKSDRDPVKSIVGKLNNLDIATGDLTGMVRGPDSLRMDLELKQKPANEAKISSDIPPEALLLNRSLCPAIWGEIDFVALKKRIEDRFPGTIDEDDMTKAVYLRPIELAVVKGDISQVKGLIDLVLYIGQGGSIVSDKETNSVVEGDPSDEEDSYYSEDSDSYYSENSSPSSSTRNIPMTSAQLRFLLVGEGSVNSSIGGLSLLQLATVVDNVDIFKAIANYGQEFSLPRRLIGFWKAKYDVGNKKGSTEAELEKMNEKTQKILRIGYSDGIIISPVHFILKVGAENLFNALVTKNLDTVLLDPIYECKFKLPESTTLDERSTLQPYFDAYSWVSTLISEKKLSREELASNICRITTPDEYNRSGLFYAPAEFIPQMLQEGCLNSINSVTGNGVTALMTAAANGETAKVQALLTAGADRSLSTTDRRWNILHLIIEVLGPEAPTKSSSSYYSSYSNKTKEEEEKDEKERLDKWREVVNVTKTIVDRANSDDLKELFLSPNADHTPLMLAVSKMADEETVCYFLDQTGQQSIDALSRRDKELNSILHLAVKALINADRFDLGVVQSIVKYAKPANTENLHGLNASEISSETVLSIWNDDHLPYKVRNIASTIDIDCKVKQQRAQLEQIYSIFKTRAEKRALYNFLVTSEMKERIAVTFEDAKKGSHEATKGVQTSKPDMRAFFQRESTCVKECCFRGP